VQLAHDGLLVDIVLAGSA